MRTGPSGEIGRHSGLKIRRLPERGRTGSIPVSGTNTRLRRSTRQQSHLHASEIQQLMAAQVVVSLNPPPFSAQ
jgi:hypothetical protein